jgi:DNA-binding IscR family transcriptional regulator
LGQAVIVDNLLGLKKDDLIKTTKGNVGIVITTNKDNIKILDVTNVVSIVNNLDYESKMNTKNLVAKNRFGD